MAAPNKPDDKTKEKEVDSQTDADRRREEAVQESTPSEIEGANRRLEDETSGKVFGDTTSTRGDANVPGYHGRDGGVAAGTDNNPAANEQADPGANAPSDGSNEGQPEAEQQSEIKKL
jgi:hypothetical protein